MNKIQTKLKVEVRELKFLESCNAKRYVVECFANTEKRCHQQLREARAVIVNSLDGSDYLLCRLRRHRGRKTIIILILPKYLVELEEDYPRSLSYLPEMTRSVDRLKLQSEGQRIPFGVSLVKADQLWVSKQNRGELVKVCIHHRYRNLN